MMNAKDEKRKKNKRPRPTSRIYTRLLQPSCNNKEKPFRVDCVEGIPHVQLRWRMFLLYRTDLSIY